MASHLMAFKCDGGIHLFTKTKGNIDPISLSLAASLNGVNLFCSSNDAQLLSTITNEFRIFWKSYHSSVTLILVTCNGDYRDWLMSQLLDLIFGVLVFTYGHDDIMSMKNVDQAKKEIKACFPILDSILESNDSSYISTLTLTTQTFSASENVILQNHLDGFSEAAQSQFGCLFINAAAAVATKRWWELSAVELVILEHAVIWSDISQGTCSELAIYLPQTSPSVPHRLIVFTLLPDVKVAVICGTSPSLDSIMQKVNGFWQSAFDSLINLRSKNFIDTANIDKNIFGFLVVNTSKNRSLMNFRQNQGMGKQRKLLCDFYCHVIGSLWFPPIPDSKGIEPTAICSSNQNHLVTDTYVCADEYKAYAFHSGAHRVFVIFNSAIPVYAMRFAAHKLLQLITKEKWTTV